MTNYFGRRCIVRKGRKALIGRKVLTVSPDEFVTRVKSG